MRVKVGVDIDDTKADFNRVLQAWHNRMYNLCLKREDILHYYLHNAWGCSEKEAFRRVYDEFYPSVDFKRVEPFEGAQDGCTLLAQQYDLVSISARPSIILTQTQQWIARHFPSTFTEVYLTDSFCPGEKRTKAEICSELGVKVMVEDAPKVALQCYKAGIDVVLLNSPWNVRERLPSGIVLVDDWKGIVREVRRIAR